MKKINNRIASIDASIDKVPKKVKKHHEKKVTETENYKFTESVRYRKKRKKIKGDGIMNWKYIFCIVIGVLLALVMFIGGIWYSYKTTPKAAKNAPQSQPMDKVIKIGLYGNIDAPEIEPKSIKVDKGDIIAFYPPEEPVRRINFRGKANFVSFTDVFTFSIPGKEGVYWLADTSGPTVFKCPQSGYINFGVSYPSLLTDFSTYVKVKKVYEIKPLKVKYVKLAKRPKEFSEPRQLVRPRGIVGGLMPDFAIEKQKRTFDLRQESQKGLDDFLKRF